MDNIILYPNYGTNPFYIDDVALLHLAQPLTFNNDVQPIAYASNCNTTMADVSPGISSFITGWGSLVQGQGNGLSQYLQATNLTIIPNPAPSQYLNAIVLYGPTSGAGPGDSGGPAVITKNGKKIQIGIASSTNFVSSYYMDVRSYASWILSITGLGNPNPPTDLYMKDRPEDLGFEPNTVSASMWSSEDIWVRNQQDGIQIQVHENPEYYANPNNHNHVYVRIRHRGCQETDYYTMKQVTLYWAKAGSALNWPSSWDGSQTYNNHPLGGVIGSVIISSLQPGQETICRVQWDVPNPAWYVGYTPFSLLDLIDGAGESHHFCILARIEDFHPNVNSDPMTYSETINLYDNILNNNNIVCKNITVVNLDPNNIGGSGTGGTIFIGDAWNNSERYKLEFANTPDFDGNKITDEAEITLSLDNPTWQKWQQGGYQGENVSIINPQTQQIRITGDNASISNLLFGANERTRIHLGFNFLTQEASEQTEYSYTVTQKDNQGNIVGGEDYLIRKQERDLFEADAGSNQEILKEDDVVITASQLTEQAIYNWYDINDSLIYTGTNLTVSPEVTTKYKLEIIATADGFKDYDTVEVKVKPFYIIDIAPNPASSNATIGYKATGATSPYLIVSPLVSGTSYQYILDPDQPNKVIDVSNYQQGVYNVILVCNGEAMDQGSLLVQ